MTSDQHYRASSPRTSSPTASSAGSCSPGRERRELAFTIDLDLLRRPAPKAHRGERGELDLERITGEFVAWQRVEWHGADPGGRHYAGAAPRMWTPAPARRPVEHEDRCGRHVPVIERQYLTMCKAKATLEAAGVMF